MNRLQPDGHLQFAVDSVAKPQAFVVAESRMILDDDRAESTDTFGDRLVICRGNCLPVEKVAAVVQLDVLCRLQPSERVIDLAGDVSLRDALLLDREAALKEFANRANGNGRRSQADHNAATGGVVI